MSNMSYCRFQNTVQDLSDCAEHFGDTDLSEDEEYARRRMKRIMIEILEDEGYEVTEA
jgi:hypothetical protein